MTFPEQWSTLAESHLRISDDEQTIPSTERYYATQRKKILREEEFLEEAAHAYVLSDSKRQSMDCEG